MTPLDALGYALDRLDNPQPAYCNGRCSDPAWRSAKGQCREQVFSQATKRHECGRLREAVGND